MGINGTKPNFQGWLFIENFNIVEESKYLHNLDYNKLYAIQTLELEPVD